MTKGSQSSDHAFNTLLQRTPKIMSGGKKKPKTEHACQNPDISDRKARRLGPAGPTSGTGACLHRHGISLG